MYVLSTRSLSYSPPTSPSVRDKTEQEVINAAIYAERDFFVSLRIKVASRRRLIRRCRRRRRCRLYVRRASLPPGPRVPPLLRLLYITFSLYYTIGPATFRVLRWMLQHRWAMGFTVVRTKILFNNHGPINNPTFVKKAGTFFGLGTQLKCMK